MHHIMKPYTIRDWYDAHKEMSWLHIKTWADHLPWWRRVGGLIPELWYYLRCRCWTRYHVVTCKTLPPTWTDADSRILHACFTELGKVINEEDIFENNAALGDPTDGRSWAWALSEMRDLWDWWTVRRPAREAEYERRLTVWGDMHRRDNPGSAWLTNTHQDTKETQAAWDSLNEMNDDIRDDEDDAMLIRLMKVRRYLWT